MFDLGWSEFLIVSAVTLVVVGPKEIPRVIKTVSKGIRQARSYASDFQRSIMDVADMQDLKDIRNTLTAENESLNKDFKDATADMETMRKQWQTDWDAELEQTTKDIDSELGIEQLDQDVHDFLKPNQGATPVPDSDTPPVDVSREKTGDNAQDTAIGTDISDQQTGENTDKNKIPDNT